MSRAARQTQHDPKLDELRPVPRHQVGPPVTHLIARVIFGLDVEPGDVAHVVAGTEGRVCAKRAERAKLMTLNHGRVPEDDVLKLRIVVESRHLSGGRTKRASSSRGKEGTFHPCAVHEIVARHAVVADMSESAEVAVHAESVRECRGIGAFAHFGEPDVFTGASIAAHDELLHFARHHGHEDRASVLHRDRAAILLRVVAVQAVVEHHHQVLIDEVRRWNQRETRAALRVVEAVGCDVLPETGIDVVHAILLLPSVVHAVLEVLLPIQNLLAAVVGEAAIHQADVFRAERRLERAPFLDERRTLDGVWRRITGVRRTVVELDGGPRHGIGGQAPQRGDGLPIEALAILEPVLLHQFGEHGLDASDALHVALHAQRFSREVFISQKWNSHGNNVGVDGLSPRVEFGTDSKSLSVGVDADSLSAGTPTISLVESSSGDYSPYLRRLSIPTRIYGSVARLREKREESQELFLPTCVECVSQETSSIIEHVNEARKIRQESVLGMQKQSSSGSTKVPQVSCCRH